MKAWQFIGLTVLGWVPFLIYVNLPAEPIYMSDPQLKTDIVSLQKDVHSLYRLYNNIHMLDREIGVYSDNVERMGRELGSIHNELNRIQEHTGMPPTPVFPPHLMPRGRGEQSQGDFRTDGKLH